MFGLGPRDLLRAKEDVTNGNTVAPSPSGALGPLAEMIAQEHFPRAYSPIVLVGLTRLYELALVLLIGFASHTIISYGNQTPWALIDKFTLPALSVLAIFAFDCAGLYRAPMFRNRLQQLFRLPTVWIGLFVVVLGTGALFGYGGTGWKQWHGLWCGLGLVALAISRIVLHLLVVKWTKNGRLIRRSVLVGGGEAGESLIRAIEKDPHTDVMLWGVFDDRTDDRSPNMVAGYPKLGTVDDLVEFARRTRLDLVIFTLPITAENRILQMLRKLSVLPLDIRLSAHTNRLKFRPRSYSYIGSVPVLDVFDKPIADWDVVVKWLFDRIVGLLLLIVFSPVMLLTAIAIKLDSRGPVFFKQRRYGFNNELIEVFKFRSMYMDQCDPTASKLTSKDDPRVTRMGRFIRKTSIDELPQLLNVALFGNLSLVGPRPHAVHAKAANQLYDEVVDGYFARHRVKPGITGWAQINGWRGETDTEEKIQHRVEHDLYYIENWSVAFDLLILAKTPLALLKTENAY
jgi:Undecaprenyl-phosphate glucose phosphotransferase